jgi:hypothetical protein
MLQFEKHVVLCSQYTVFPFYQVSEQAGVLWNVYIYLDKAACNMFKKFYGLQLKYVGDTTDTACFSNTRSFLSYEGLGKI